MKEPVLVCLSVSILIISSTVLAARTASREEHWVSPADRAEAVSTRIDEAVGPGDVYNLIVTGDANDNIGGTPGNDHIRSCGGEDQVQGYGGDDILEGGADADMLSGGEGNDHIRGQTGDDTLLGGGGDDVLIGGPGRDYLMGNMGDDVVYGGDGMDEGHYLVDENYFSSDYYDGGPGYDLFNFRVPPEFDMGTANEIEIQFMSSSGYFDFSPWGIDLVIVNFEDLLVVWEPGLKLGAGERSFETEEATWGGIKALYR
jgi:hypothetical protein